jgi:diamine N-acetyltransferase
MEHPLSIRMATIGDAETLTELAWRTFHDAFSSMNSAQIADPRATFLVAEIEATPVAYAKLYDGEVPACVSGLAPVEIERFYVDRQYHGKGLAQTLMQVCLDRARQSGYETVYLGVWEKNHRAIAFYQKYGFEIVGSHAFQLGDEPQNDFWMERRLQESAQ